VAKNDEFQALAYDIAMHISAMNPADTEALMAEQFIKDPSLTISNLIENAVQKFGEKIELSRFARFSVTN
jgi:elongation factor Ts